MSSGGKACCAPSAGAKTKLPKRLGRKRSSQGNGAGIGSGGCCAAREVVQGSGGSRKGANTASRGMSAPAGQILRNCIKDGIPRGIHKGKFNSPASTMARRTCLWRCPNPFPSNALPHSCAWHTYRTASLMALSTARSCNAPSSQRAMDSR